MANLLDGKFLIKIRNKDSALYGQYWKAPGEGTTRSKKKAHRHPFEEALQIWECSPNTLVLVPVKE